MHRLDCGGGAIQKAEENDVEHHRNAQVVRSAPEWVKVCQRAELENDARIDVRIRGRQISVFIVGTTCVAIDSICYHMGGPLSKGRVTRIGSRVCVTCPWHGHRVDLSSGEGLYDGGGELKSKGLVQRVHETKVEDNAVWVRLRLSSAAVRSDEYAFGPKHPGIRTDYDSLPCFDW